MAADAADPAGNGRLPLPDITFLSLFHRKKSPFGGSQRRRGLFLLTAHRRGGSAKTARKAHGLCSFPDGAFRGRKSARQKVRTATSRADTNSSIDSRCRQEHRSGPYVSDLARHARITVTHSRGFAPHSASGFRSKPGRPTRLVYFPCLLYHVFSALQALLYRFYSTRFLTPN